MGGVEAHQHFVGDLGVARLVGAYQPHAVAAEDRYNAIQQKKYRKRQKDHRFAGGCPGKKTSAAALQSILLRQIRGHRRFPFRSHFQQLSNNTGRPAGSKAGRPQKTKQVVFRRLGKRPVFPEESLLRVQSGSRLSDRRGLIPKEKREDGLRRHGRGASLSGVAGSLAGGFCRSARRADLPARCSSSSILAWKRPERSA